ncbi:MAG: hypothetical protein AAGC65_11790 [Mucilaginibacter sp.]|uniref:hypothetical protein n=1 Tax=Mucilaginibacter sp. TaxID=1882438 RepID=UPI0031A002EB
MRLLSILIIASLLVSCSSSPSNSHDQALKPAKKIDSVKVDTIRINKTLALKEHQVEVLRDGLYHDSEVDPLLSHRSWKGLFIKDHQSYIADVKVKLPVVLIVW